MISSRSIAFKRFIDIRKFASLSIKRYQSENAAAKLYEPNDDETRRIANLPDLVKKPQRPPFVKNFLVANYDGDLLAYPEFLGERRLRLLDANTEFLQKVISENVDSAEIDRICDIPEKVLDVLRNLKIFGMSAPIEYGGLDLTHTERARLYEVLAEDTSLAAMLFSHETLGLKLISHYGNKEQKDKYLKKLVTGKSTAAYCANEPECGADIANISTYALKTSDGYIISGTKCWVMNADRADLFLVFAKPKTAEDLQNPVNRYYSNENEKDGEFRIDDVGVFLVNKHSPGITISERKDTTGVRGLHMCDVKFDNTPVPFDHIIGDFKQGYDIAKKFLVEDRYLIGVFALSILRKMVKQMTEFSITHQLYGDSLCNYGLTQVKLAKATVNLYAIESMIYFTCGLQDMYENQDCEIENAITKIYCSELAWQTITDVLQLLGGQAYIKNQPYERYMRDLKVLSMFDVSNEVLRMFIALCGMKYISNDISDEIVKGRNPFYHPKDMMKKALSRLRIETDNPKLYLKLYEYLHPSLCSMSEVLEKCVLRYEFGVANASYREGPMIVENQWALNRIAEGAIQLYAMTAVISRASRSYCIGTKHADEEMVIAEAFLKEAHDKFNDIVIGLTEGDVYVTDQLRKKVAERTIKSRGYFAVEPLKLNY